MSTQPTVINTVVGNAGVIKPDIAMVGELTLKGRVLPIGGLKEKLSAAARENIKAVIHHSQKG